MNSVAKDQDERRKRMQRKLAAAERFSSELALLLSLLVHAALFCCLKIEKRPRNNALANTMPDCVLLSPYSEKARWTGWERELRAWRVLADPTLFTVSDEELGFGYVRRGERELPATEVPAFRYQVSLSEDTPFAAFSLAVPLPGLSNEISAKWRAAPPPLPSAPPVTPLPKGEVIWRLPDGTLLSDVPALNKDELDQALASAGPGDSPTVIEVNRETDLVRIRVRESCGNPGLDRLLVKTLRKCVIRIRNQKTQPSEQSSVFGDCFPAEGQSRTFEVDWRLL